MVTEQNCELPVSFIIAVNDEDVLRNNALVSSAFRDGRGHEVLLQRNFPSASLAYNEAIERAQNDLIVCMHQDVYLPEGWVENLQKNVDFLDAAGRSWGVLGCYGISLQGTPAGHIFSNGLNRELGGPHPPAPVQSLDEAVLVLRKSSGLRFDLNLPHFHLYGADICLQARRNGLANYAMSNFCVHNSIAIRTLPAEFWRCAEYLRIKWQDELPVKTSCIVLSRGQSAMWIRRTRTELGFLRARKARGASHRLANPKINPACGTNPK